MLRQWATTAPHDVPFRRQVGWAALVLLTASICLETVAFLLFAEDWITFVVPLGVIVLYVPLGLATTSWPRSVAVVWLVVAIGYAILANGSPSSSHVWLVFAVPRGVAAVMLVFAEVEERRRANWQRSLIAVVPVVVGLVGFLLVL